MGLWNVIDFRRLRSSLETGPRLWRVYETWVYTVTDTTVTSTRGRPSTGSGKRGRNTTVPLTHGVSSVGRRVTVGRGTVGVWARHRPGHPTRWSSVCPLKVEVVGMSLSAHREEGCVERRTRTICTGVKNDTQCLISSCFDKIHLFFTRFYVTLK